MVGFRGMLGEAPTAWTSQDGLSWTSTALPIDADTDSSFSHDVACEGRSLMSPSSSAMRWSSTTGWDRPPAWPPSGSPRTATTWTRVPPESLRSDETVADLRADTVYRAGTRWVVFGTTDSPSENVQPVVWLGKDPALPRFDDVAGDHLFAVDVEWLAEQEITRGCNPPFNTRFCPDLDVTRGQMAAFLVRALHYTDNGGGDLFTDDDTLHLRRRHRQTRHRGSHQRLQPTPQHQVLPDLNVTRGQMAAFLVRALHYTDNGGGDLFTDDDNSTFEDDIDKLATAGVTKGCNPPLNTKYCPDLNVTRGQMAAFLHRATGD